MKAYIFPGQGSQFTGMGKDLYEKSALAAAMFEQANEILGFRITDLMFAGSEEDLKQTKVTQPAVFLHSVILAAAMENSFKPDMVAGHSLGEYSALVASKALSFEDGLRLVSKRANAMQKTCELNPSTMAAILGLNDKTIEEVCTSIPEIVVPANYNSTGQIVISGSVEGIDKAIEILKAQGAKRTIKLAVSGAFHSPFMEPAKLELEDAINNCSFNKPICPVYQNVTAQACSDPAQIKLNLALQLTAPVLWTQSSVNMITAGAKTFIEVGPGNVLQGLIKKINKDIVTESTTID